MDKREIRQMMQLLQIEDVTTKRQLKNGTITWRLPIKIGSGNRNIEVGSFKSGYIRNNNCGYSNYQLNKRCEGEPEYFETAGFKPGETLYRKFTTRSCVLIPDEQDRLQYLIDYCLKNYYVKLANEVTDPPHSMEEVSDDCGHYTRIRDLENKLDTIQRISDHG